MSRKDVRVTCFIVVPLLLLWILFAPNGAMRYLRLQRQVTDILAANGEITKQNKELEAEVQRLEKDKSYIEDIARMNYGLIKKNEIIFQFKSRKKE